MQIAPTNKEEIKSGEKKDSFRRNNNMAKSMKVSNMAKQLEAVLNRPKPALNSGSITPRTEEANIIHEKVDLAGDNSGDNSNLFRASKKKKKSPIVFEDS